jgi:L-malate glycosyltransferase
MQPKAKTYRLRATSPASLFESRNCLFILAVNWLLQGMRGMDPKELGFRLILLALMAGLAAWPLAAFLGLSGLAALALGLGIGHTLNFLLNGQLWVVLRYCPAYRQDPARLAARISALLDDVARQSWLGEAVLMGSTVTRLKTPRSRADIDLRLIFPPGVAGWLRTNLYLLRLRFLAACRGLPLDLYAYAHPAVLRRFDQSEPLGIILDRQVRLKRGFANRRLVWLR